MKTLKATFLSIFLLTCVFSAFSQGGFEFSHKKWNSWAANHPYWKKDTLTEKNLEPCLTKAIKTYKLDFPENGSGYVIYGTPGFIIPVTEATISNGSLQSTGVTITPGIEYFFVFGKYRAATNTPTSVSNWFGLGAFAAAGESGTPFKAAVKVGVTASIATYGQLGWDIDVLTGKNSYLIGLAVPFNIVFSGATGSILWTKATTN